MIKYIASDLDGTLLQDEAMELDPEVFDLILTLKERGIRFIAASGRQYYNLYHLFGPVRDEISYIAENGSLCIHDKKVVSRGLIDRDLGFRIIDAARELSSCSCLLSCESRAYTDSKDPAFLEHMNSVICYDIERVDDLKNIEEPFLKFSVCDFNGSDMIEHFFQERFSSEIAAVTSGNIWLDFISPEANKGSALASITRHLGIFLADGIAFGDQFNDIEMLTMAGTGYAMKNCAPGVEAYADARSESVVQTIRELLGI